MVVVKSLQKSVARLSANPWKRADTMTQLLLLTLHRTCHIQMYFFPIKPHVAKGSFYHWPKLETRFK